MKKLFFCFFTQLLFTQLFAQESIHYFTKEEHRVAFVVEGKGEPILLLHAGLLDHKMFERQKRELSRHYTLIIPDLPGHGLSNDAGNMVISDLLTSLMDSLGFNHFNVLGVSLGALCATELAIRKPDKIRKVVLVSPGLIGFDQRFGIDSATKQYNLQFFEKLRLSDTSGAAELFTRYWFDGPFRIPTEMSAFDRLYIYQTSYSMIRTHAFRSFPRFADSLAIDRLYEINSPMLIMVGGKDAKYIEDAVRLMDTTVKNSVVLRFPFVGHMINMEDPKPFNRQIIRFFRTK